MATRHQSAPFIWCAVLGIAAGSPDVSFPFNSQVPAAARVNIPYNFQLSDSTFAPGSSNFTYSLSNQPAWLTIDSATRTLTGTPSQAHVGSSNFTLTAADNTGAAHLQCTLVVSQDPAPQLSGDISKQLAATANLSSSHPPVVTLLPSTVFQFDFQQESFIDIVQRKLYYYATLSDHTPLPSWLKFDASLLTFSGTAPSLSAFPQSWNIQLIASDVPGFSATSASFTMAIGTEQLAFVPEEQELNAMAGRHLNFTSLRDQLFRNGAILPPQEWKSVEASPLLPWLHFDSSTLALEGDVPANMEEQNFTVTVTDLLGNIATATINLLSNNASLFEGQVGTIVAEAGKTLHYHFDDTIFSEPDLDLSVELPADAQWLKFQAATRELTGTVPSSASSATVKATLIAKPNDGDESQSQVFTVDIKAATTVKPTPSGLTTRTSPTNTSTSTPGSGLVVERPSSKLSGGVIAAIVVLSLVGATMLVACLIWCCRRRRRQGYERQSPTPSKKPISRPIPPPEGGDTITVTTELQRDVEKDAGSDEDPEAAISQPKTAESPPQITLNSLNLPSHPAKRRSRWSKRFSRLSYASSIGQGDAAIRADSNIPALGQDASGLHTPHDSFSEPAEMARNSRHLSQISPSKRAHRKSRQQRESGDHVGLGITSSATSGIARHSSKRIDKHRRGRSSLSGLSTTQEASSMASITTARTSLLSTKPSEFPLPPHSQHSASTSLPALSVITADTLRDPKRKSIRMVQRSDSVADTRPPDVKRESFIRNRAIAKNGSRASIQSPLFAHGSRASSLLHRQGSRSANSSLTGSVRHTRRSRNGKSMLTTYSESSSLEPQLNDPRRSNTRESKRLSRRVKSSSPLSANVQVVEPSSVSPTRKTSRSHPSRFSEPIDLVSADSMHKGRPRLAENKSRRPVSVEEVQRLSSMKAEHDEATTAGSEQWEDVDSNMSDLEGAGLGPRAGSGRVGTQKSDMSGPAFL